MLLKPTASLLNFKLKYKLTIKRNPATVSMCGGSESN